MTGTSSGGTRYAGGSGGSVGEGGSVDLSGLIPITTTFWGQAVADGAVQGDMSGVGNISFNASGKNIGSLIYFDTTNSRVGIGVSTPSKKMDVGGNILLAGDEISQGAYYNNIETVYGSNGDLANGITANSSVRHALSFKWYSTDWQIGNMRSSDSSSDGFAVVENISGTKRWGLRVYNDGNNQYVTQAQYGVRIGDGLIVWDSTNNALKVQKADGTVASIYATGGVSALGMMAGVSELDAMTFGYMNITNQLTFSDADYGGIIDTRGGDLIIGTSNNNAYIMVDDICSSDGHESWLIETTGVAFFSASCQSPKFYLDGTHFFFLDSGVLKFYNGSTAKTVQLV